MEAIQHSSEAYPPHETAEIYQPTPEPHPMALPLAGGLQAVYNNVVHKRDFTPDIHQDEAIQAIGKALVSGESSGYVEMATSTGKTLIESMLVEAAVRAGMRVLMLAPSKNIADQLYGQDGQTGLGRFTYLTHGKNVRRHYGSARANNRAPVVVSTYAGLNAEAKKGEEGVLGNFDLIIGDECHWSLGPETSHNMRTYMPNAIKIGFSATPDFAADRTSEEIFGTPLFEFSLAEAVKKGATAPAQAIIYKTATRLELWDSRSSFSEAELKPLIYDANRNKVAINVARHLARYRKQRGIIACVPGNENEHAITLAEELRDFGVAAEDVGVHLSRTEIKNRLARFKSGDTKVLTFTSLLEEGWDSDVASFCINLAPTTSPRRTKQLLGRILRKKKDGRAGLYIDFADEKVGKQKSQYTACHALGYYNHDLTRVLGKPGNSEVLPLEELLPADIYAHVKKSQDLLLEDMLKTKDAPVDPNKALIKEWEERLEREGMPAEISQHPLISLAHEKMVGKYITKLVRTANKQGTSPDLSMAAIAKDIRPQYLKEILLTSGVRVDFDDNLEEIETSQVASTDDILEEIAFEEANAKIHEVFDTLSEREAGVVSLRYGVPPVALDRHGKPFPYVEAVIARTDGSLIDASTREVIQEAQRKEGVHGPHVEPRDVAMQVKTTYPRYEKPVADPEDKTPGEPHTLDQIGKVYGVTRERVKQIEAKTLEKLRDPSRSKHLLQGVAVDDARPEIEKDPLQKIKNLHVFSTDMSQVPVFAEDDDTPYEERLLDAMNKDTHATVKKSLYYEHYYRIRALGNNIFTVMQGIARVQSRPVAIPAQRETTMRALQQRIATLIRERDQHMAIVENSWSDKAKRDNIT